MKHYLYLHTQSARSALLKILRQPFGNLLNLLMLAIALALPVSLYLGVSSLQQWTARLNTTPQITLFMELSSEQADLAAVESSLKHHPRVASFRFVHKDDALKELEQRSGLSAISEGLGSNPLPHAFIVTPQPLEPAMLDLLQKELSGLPMVELAQFDAAWARKLHAMITLAGQLAWLLAVVFALAMVLINHNTIRMQILARQEEIAVSKLIGATDSFIRRPFLYHAAWQGGLSALLCWGLSSWLAYQANPALAEFASLYGIDAQLRSLQPLEVLAMLLGAMLLSMLGARLAADHHLRKNQPV